jgi:hypothetical protein
LIEELRQLLADPFTEHPTMARFAQPPSADAPDYGQLLVVSSASTSTALVAI